MGHSTYKGINYNKDYVLSVTIYSEISLQKGHEHDDVNKMIQLHGHKLISYLKTYKIHYPLLLTNLPGKLS